MMLELSVLGGATTLVAAAIWLRREIPLLFAVLIYAGAVNWLLQRDLSMLLPALGIAMALGVTGIALSLRAEERAQDAALGNSE